LTTAAPIRPDAPTLRRLAHDRLVQGDIAGAVQAHVHALQLQPRHREEAKRLAVVLGEIGRDAHAEPLIQALDHARLRVYQADVDALRDSRYLDYPRHVHLETLARCNARCDFCPSPGLERTGARLSDALIDKIITDLQDMPADLGFQLSPFKVNEPFLDVRLFDVLDDIEARLPQASIALTTNASALTPNKLARLHGRRALRDLYISFNDHRPQAYTETMGLPWERTLARIDALHRAMTRDGLDLRVTVSRVGDGSAVDDRFRLWVVDRWPGFATLVLRRGDWLGQVQTPVHAVPDVGCQRWFELSITATGQVAHCCMDGEARWPLGDVSQQHVLEVYNQPAYRALREQTRSRRQAEPCASCTFF